jgi:hypothetical protein
MNVPNVGQASPLVKGMWRFVLLFPLWYTGIEPAHGNHTAISFFNQTSG